MENYALLVSGIEFKIRNLLDLKQQLLAKLEETREQLLNTEAENKVLKERIAALEYENNLLRLGQRIISSGQSKKMKRLLDDAISEVDKSIAYLTKEWYG